MNELSFTIDNGMNEELSSMSFFEKAISEKARQQRIDKEWVKRQGKRKGVEKLFVGEVKGKDVDGYVDELMPYLNREQIREIMILREKDND